MQKTAFFEVFLPFSRRKRLFATIPSVFRECFVSTACYNTHTDCVAKPAEDKIPAHFEEAELKNWKLTAAKLSNPTALRVLYILLALLAMALAGGAPESYGGS